MPPRGLGRRHARGDAVQQVAKSLRRQILPEAHVRLVDLARHRVPRGEMVFALAGGGPSLRDGTAFWRGWVRYGGQPRFAVWARVRAAVTRPRVVAAETLAAGRRVEARQGPVKSAEEFPSGPAWALEEVVGRAPRQAVPAGAPVRRDLMAPHQDVLRGETVRAEARVGETRVEIEGRAEADGRVGDSIPARLEGPGRVVALGSAKP
jgi:flagella basal body P-ring formation protein FlgA